MKRISNSLSIKSRLLLMMLAVSLISSLIIGFLGWQTGRNALDNAIGSQLTSIRSSRAYQIETYFERIFSQTRTLAEDRMVVNAMQSFKVGYGEALERTLTPEQYEQIEQYYQDAFLPQLSENVGQANLLIRYLSQRQVANYFQYHYLVNNQFPDGQKDELVLAPNDTTTYSRIHEFYHPVFRNLLYEFGYHDIFLIDLESGNIVYSVYKEVDYATSLIEGPYSESGLGVLAAKIRAQPERDRVTIVDFRSYEPSYGAPAAFVGAPIFDGNTAIGILALQLPVAEINNVMTGGEGWATDGLGETGETFLVGSDGFMRSVSRHFIEDKEGLLEDLGQSGVIQTQLDGIQTFDTTVMQLPVSSQAVTESFSGLSDTLVVNSYRGTPVLSSFERLNIEGLDWAVLAEIEEQEAFGPITNMQRRLLLWTVSLILLVAFAALLLARGFLRPIETLNDSVKAINQGAENVKIEADRNDEIGELGESFLKMFAKLREQKSHIAEQDASYDALLHRVLPEQLVERYKAGETIADSFPQVSLVYIRVSGLSHLESKHSPFEQANLLGAIYKRFDAIGKNYEMDRVETLGETYVTANGLSTARLDHAKRAVNFAHDIIKDMMTFSANEEFNLALQVGINTGAVYSAVIGDAHLNYEVWGKTAKIANQIHLAAAPNTILVTEAVKTRLGNQITFSDQALVSVTGEDDISVHAIEVSVPTGDTGALNPNVLDGGIGK